MEALALLIGLLVLGVPIILAIWLIVRAVQSGKRIEELSRRVGEVELELFQLKKERREPAHAPEQTSAPEPTPAPAPTCAPPIATEMLASLRADTAQEAATTPVETPHEEIIEPPSPPPPPTPIPPFAKPPPIPAAAPIPEPTFVPTPIYASTIEPEPAAAKSFRQAEPPPVAEKGSFEMRLGTYWLVRVGAVLILTAMAFGSTLAYQKLSAGGKVGLLYFVSALLLGAGAWWQRKTEKPSMRNYAQVLFAGGLAAVYFTTYAAHHIAQLCVIQSPTLDGALLLAWAGFMAWIADRRKSEVLALFAVGLAYYTSVITHVGAFTLYSNLVLTLVAVVFLVRNRWAWLSFASLVATYASYAFWRFFHGGEWRWATPEEGLWLGGYFLMSYWLVFTAAVFLSKHEKLAGENRAGFLTLNNGAFFTLFLLTMLQVHSGGFWKFSLIYGAVLLALVEASRRILPAEPLTKNAYLTQGLLLVTVGFISKFAGLQLALVLAAESVVLFVLGTQRRSLILQIGAFIAGALSVSWGFDGLERFDTHGLWLGSALGGLMMFNSFWAHRQTAETNRGPFRPVPAYFAALALIIWGFTTWQNTTQANFGLVLIIEALLLTLSIYVLRVPEITLLGQTYLLVAQAVWQFDVPKSTAQLTALVLAVQSVIALRLGWQRKDLVLQASGYVAAALAVAWGIEGLERFETMGLLTGVALVAMMLFQAFLSHRQSAETDKNSLRNAPTYFSALVVALAITTTWFNTSQVNCPLFLAAEAIALTATIYLLRVREVALLGQLLLLAGHCAWQLNLFEHGSPPWWNPALMISMTLGLGHWWQKQKVVVVDDRAPQAFQLVLSLLFVLLVCAWLGKECTDTTWLAVSCLLAVAVTAYAAATRAWLLAACAQLFLLPGAWLFLQQLGHDGEPRFAALAPIAALGVLSFGTVQWFKQNSDSDPRVRDPLLVLAMAYRWVALAMSLWWVMEYIAHREQIWTLMLIGLAVFAFAGWRRNREALLFGAAFSALATLLVWVRCLEPELIYLPNAIAILALLGQQQIAQRLPVRYNLAAQAHAAMIVIGGLTLWLFVSRWVMRSASGFYLTASWSGLALALFACGMALRERMYRWLGLAVLAAALGRVVVFDVWKLETIFRILSFTALGIVLLVLGYIYNKYQEKIRQWL